MASPGRETAPSCILVGNANHVAIFCMIYSCCKVEMTTIIYYQISLLKNTHTIIVLVYEWMIMHDLLNIGLRRPEDEKLTGRSPTNFVISRYFLLCESNR